MMEKAKLDAGNNYTDMRLKGIPPVTMINNTRLKKID
jgi:hypothetical protein